MRLLDRFRPQAQVRSQGLDEALAGYDLVEVNDAYALAVPAAQADRPALGTQMAKGATEYGAALRGDYNPRFANHQTAMQTYMEMKNDAQVRSALRVVKSPVLAARWFVEPADSEDPLQQEIAQFVWNNITKWMTTSWPQMLIETLLMADYGMYAFEKVFERRPDTGLVYWRKFVPIHPTEIAEPIYDEQDGGYAGIKLSDEDETEIPIEKLLVFTFEGESGDMMGKSVLRSAYKHWFYKENLYKIDAIQKERHGIGIPIIKLPMGYKPEDISTAHNIGETLRTNEKAHVVIPPLWEIAFAKLEGQPVDTLESAQHHGMMVYENVLATFMNTFQNRSVDYSEQMFMKGTRFIADVIRDVWNKYAIPQLVSWNWDVEDFPELRVRRLGDTIDHRTISFAARNFAGMGALVPDDDLEDWIREEMDLPKRDMATARQVEARQLPNMVPRQTPAPNMKTAPDASAGTDASGQGA